MGLVAIAQTLEDFNGVGDGGLFNLDRLEPTLECSVLFEMLAVLVECGGTNGLEFTTSKHWLENAGRIDGAFGSTSSNEGVDFVDEQNDVAACLDFFEHLLEALFEIAAVT